MAFNMECNKSFFVNWWDCTSKNYQHFASAAHPMTEKEMQHSTCYLAVSPASCGALLKWFVFKHLLLVYLEAVSFVF